MAWLQDFIACFVHPLYLIYNCLVVYQWGVSAMGTNSMQYMKGV